MANLLTEMLKLAGFDAHFAWIGYLDIPYDIKDVKSFMRSQSRYFRFIFKRQDLFYRRYRKVRRFLVRTPTAYRVRQCWYRTVIRIKTEKVPDAKIDDNQIITKATLKLDNGKITGHIALTFNGSAKSLFSTMYNNIPAEKEKTLSKSAGDKRK